MTLKDGDFILVDFSIKEKDTDRLINTSKEEVAEKYKVVSPVVKYQPLLLVLGENWLELSKVDEELKKYDPNTSFTLEILPKDAYGNRNPDNVKITSIRALTNRGLPTRPGSVIMFDGRECIVRTVSGGRVKLDFNHLLAGKTLVYEFDILNKIEDNKEKIMVLLGRRLPDIDPEEFKIRISKKTISIHHPEESYYLEGIQLSKRAVSADIKRFIPEIEEVKFIEVY